MQTQVKTIDGCWPVEAAAEAARLPAAAAPAPSAAVHVAACPEPPPAPAARPLWPWLVSGTAIAVAGGVVAAVLLTRAGKGDACGTLGCLNER